MLTKFHDAVAPRTFVLVRRGNGARHAARAEVRDAAPTIDEDAARGTV